MFCKKGVLENFSKFTGKHLWILRNLQEHLFLQSISGGCFVGNLNIKDVTNNLEIITTSLHDPNDIYI